VEFLLEEFAAAGLTWVQWRNKQASSRDFFEQASRFVALARSRGLISIINDRVDIARLCTANGVHLGQEDLPVEHARKILGSSDIIGYSTHNRVQAMEAEASSADYVAVGPVFATTSKENPDPIVSESDLLDIRKHVRKPLVAIGGITVRNATSLFAIGIDSVAVIKDLLCAPDLRQRIREFLSS
jgi:thiamine-phosphate pyrophosphorylase